MTLVSFCFWLQQIKYKKWNNKAVNISLKVQCAGVKPVSSQFGSGCRNMADSVLVSGEYTLMKTWLLTLYSSLSSESCTLDLWNIKKLWDKETEGGLKIWLWPWTRMRRRRSTWIMFLFYFRLHSDTFSFYFFLYESNKLPSWDITYCTPCREAHCIFYLYNFLSGTYQFPPRRGGDVWGRPGRVTQVEVVERRWVEIRPCSFGHGGHKSC